MLHELLREPLDACLDTPEDCRERARAIRDAYTSLNRQELGADRVLEIKFAGLHWRHKLLNRLQSNPPAWLGADDNIVGDIFAQINCRLPDALLASLARSATADTYHYLLALQGRPSGHSPQLDVLAGPGVTLKIRANRDSPWTFNRWKREPAFARYDFSGEGVNYRGVHFRPGDVLLANVNLDGNGVYTTLSEPTRFSSHAAIFAMLEDGARRFPAVVETYEKGVRAVPLNVFLDPSFCAYVEIYRHTDLEPAHFPGVNRAAVSLMMQAKGYNFDSSEDNRSYVSCCSVARLIHADAGVEPASIKSRISHPVIQANLERLGYRHFDFFAPVDYLLDTNFRCTGWVDNYQFEDLLAREIVEGYFREQFMTRTLNPKRFPLRSRVNEWGIGHIRRGTLVGRAIGRVEGFDPDTLPKGPDPLLAVITLVEAQLGRVIKRAKRWVRRTTYAPDYFSLPDFAGRSDVRHFLASNLKLRWLE